MAFGDAIERIRVALEEHDCRPRGGAKLRARCPVHESHGPTLAVSQGRAGAVMYCHAQCETRDILAAIGLCMDDMFDEPRQHEQPRFIRRAVVPATGAEMAGRVIIQALRIVMLRDEMAAEPHGPEVPWEMRVQRAEDGCRQDADAHYWRTMGHWSALACDKTYVQKAYADLAAYQAREPDAQFTHEQAVVLVIRAEDLSRTAPDVRGTCPGDVPPDVRANVPSDVPPEVRQCPPGHVRGRNLTVVGGPS